MARNIKKFKIVGRVQEAFGSDGYSRFWATDPSGRKWLCDGAFVNANDLKGEFYLLGQIDGENRFEFTSIAGVDIRTREAGMEYAKHVFELPDSLAAKWLMAGTAAFIKMEVEGGIPESLPFTSDVEIKFLRDSINKNIKKHDYLTHLSEAGFKVPLLLKADREHDDFVMQCKRNPYMLYHLGVAQYFAVDKYVNQLFPDMAHNDPRRIVAKCCNIIEKRIRENGHSMVPFSKIKRYAIKNLYKKDEKWSQSEIFHALSEQQFYPLVEVEQGGENKLFCIDLHVRQMEIGFAQKVKEKIKQPGVDPEQALKALEVAKQALGTPTEEQLNAIYQSMVRKLSIITGGPGVGKSFTMKGIVHCFHALDKMMGKAPRKIVIAAPTGVVADMLTEDISNHFEDVDEARTLHDVISWERIGEDDIEHGEIDGDVFIIDEAGMKDLAVSKSLLDGIPKHAHVIEVGDPEQLASIGIGQPFADMIDSQQVQVSALTQTRRQREGSEIIEVYQHIKKHAEKAEKGEEIEPLDLSKFVSGNGDVMALPIHNSEDGLSALKMVTEYASRHFGFSQNEIQVVSPVKATQLGTNNLNEFLRGLVNGKKKKTFVAGKAFALNDRVMVTKTNKNKKISNGMQGQIISEGKDRKGRHTFNIQFGEREVTFYEYEMKHVELAYAVTVHKTQGAQYPCVIMPISSDAGNMLQNRILSVGASRARQKLIFLYENDAWEKALKNTFTHKKVTYLKEELIKAVGKKPAGPSVEQDTPDKDNVVHMKNRNAL